jgi:hypothetical protein
VAPFRAQLQDTVRLSVIGSLVFLCGLFWPTTATAQVIERGGVWLGATVVGGYDLAGTPSRFGGDGRMGMVLSASLGTTVARDWRIGVEAIGAGDVGNVQLTAIHLLPAANWYIKAGAGPAFGRRWDAGFGSTVILGWRLPLRADYGTVAATTGMMGQWFGRDVHGKSASYVLLFGLQGFVL